MSDLHALTFRSIVRNHPIMATKAPPRRGRPRLLSVERIVEAAIWIVERDGVAALTMQTVAQELRVGTMTLYGYVDSRDDLIERAIAHLLAGGPRVPTTASGDWTQSVVEHCLAARRWAAARPALLVLDAERPTLSDAIANNLADDISGLMRGGLSLADAAVLRQAIAVQLIGQLKWEEIRRAAERSGSAQRKRERARSGDVPLIVAEATAVIEALDPEDVYERSLRALLAGFKS